MCSQFQLQNTMDNTNFQGDLADIFLGGGANTTTPTTTTTSGESSDWQFPTANPINYPSGIEQDFGDPFCNLRDPLFHDLDMMPPSSSLLSSNEGSSSNKSMILRPKSLEDHEEMNKQPTGSIFSRMLQISPTIPCNSAMAPSTVGGGASLLVSNEAIMSPNTSKTLLVENSGLQISSPRNTGIKRRKSQAKKVVCIPAAAPANNRQGGEVVPSDLWAWRKYGQKPIKGSPYPRGYYRCSSSKGCSARKQVERSRTDPNMLVITYTCEHNHPWPTQRNALAGSTRSHPLSKNTIPKDNIIKSKEAEQNTTSVINIAKVKEEVAEQGMHIDDSYQPAAALPPDSHEDFFADLAELEADPLNLLFARTFSGDDHKNAFSLYDWSTNKDGSSSTSNK